MSTQPTLQILEDASELLTEIEANYQGVRVMENFATRIEDALAVSDYETLQGLVNNCNALRAQNTMYAEDII